MIGLVITGTDTAVGKTTITVGLTQLLRRQGMHVRVSKPVATGACEINGRLISDDTVALAKAAGQLNLDEITPWVFAEPVAPAVAARLHGASLDLELMTAAVRGGASAGDGRHDVILVEGVGGLLCPLTETDTVADLAKSLDLPLVILTRRSLGTLNHTLLTLEAAKARGLRVTGLVINETEPCRGLAAETNVEELRRRIDVPILAVVPYGGDAAENLAKTNWRRLMGKGGNNL
jgi:dethiobiotin synthetase